MYPRIYQCIMPISPTKSRIYQAEYIGHRGWVSITSLTWTQFTPLLALATSFKPISEAFLSPTKHSKKAEKKDTTPSSIHIASVTKFSGVCCVPHCFYPWRLRESLHPPLLFFPVGGTTLSVCLRAVGLRTYADGGINVRGRPFLFLYRPRSVQLVLQSGTR